MRKIRIFPKIGKRDKRLLTDYSDQDILKSRILVDKEKIEKWEIQRNLDWIYKVWSETGYETYCVNWKSVDRTLLQGWLVPRQMSKCFFLNK